jgi:hypothetical protein
MSHRTYHKTLHVRNECKNKCFINYQAKHTSPSACACGCGGTYAKDHEILRSSPIPLIDLNTTILKQKQKCWLFVLDFFDERNTDIFKTLKYQNKIELTIEGCVRTFYKNYVAKNLVHELRKKGITEIWLGVESGSEVLRNSYTKPHFTNEQLRECCFHLKKEGIKICWYMVHSEEDTRDTIIETNNLVRECNPDLVWYSLLLHAS